MVSSSDAEPVARSRPYSKPDGGPSLRAEPLLFEHFPSLKRVLAWMPLAHVPTPVEPMHQIAAWLGRDDVWMKRDDAISPIYGGNKVRRYEYVLADAKRRGAERILTVGGLASTQVMATALFGKSLGLKVSAVLFDQPATSFMRQALLTDALAGCELIYGGGYALTAIKALGAYWRAPRTYFIPPGAANPIANLGYLDAMFELAEQVHRGEMPRPDVIVLPTGSSGTLAAMGIGARLLGWPTRIIGVRITLRIATNRLTIGAITHATWRFLRTHAKELGRRGREPIDYTLLHSTLGEGYGYPTEAAIEALPLVERLIGSVGEVTYSAKALVGLREIARIPELRDATILFWNTLSSRRPKLDGLDPRALLPHAFHRFFDGALAV